MTTPPEANTDVELLRRQHLEAVVVQACPDCRAPGVYKSEESIRVGWPGCYVSPHDPLDTQLVGDVCPNCGASRLPHIYKGQIWYREWWGRMFMRGSRL